MDNKKESIDDILGDFDIKKILIESGVDPKDIPGAESHNLQAMCDFAKLMQVSNESKAE